jgi:hypothetical protein
MADRIKLNGLQTRTLALLQELASHEDFATTDAATGEVTIHHMPHAHGDHMHVGRFAVSSRFASGLQNPSVWVALERKGLARSAYPLSITLTKQGLEFKTGIREHMLEDSDH